MGKRGLPRRRSIRSRRPAADPGPGSPYAGALAGLVRQRRQPCPLHRDAQESRCTPLAPRPRFRSQHAPARPPRGSVGHAGLQVLHSLIFDFLNHRTGRLDPSYAAIAHKAGVCVRTVAAALKRLRELGILNWVRRCAENWRDGRFVLEQETNAYAVLPESQWRGYRPPAEPPGPAPGTWGGPAAVLPSAVALAALEADLASKVQALATDPKDSLARALASLGRAFMARDS
jgi:hypothetical protein